MNTSDHHSLQVGWSIRGCRRGQSFQNIISSHFTAFGNSERNFKGNRAFPQSVARYPEELPRGVIESILTNSCEWASWVWVKASQPNNELGRYTSSANQGNYYRLLVEEGGMADGDNGSG